MASTDKTVCPICGTTSCPGVRECRFYAKQANRCPGCGTQLEPEHAHERCRKCGYISSCCNP